MNEAATPWNVAAALVASQGRPAAEPARAALLHAPHAPAREAVEHARVELYCDHDEAALRALRDARGALRDAGDAPNAALAVEEAAWHIRRHHPGEAQAALRHAHDALE
ncbi:hypothetical protein [Piscinibacter sakaiensis]|uniref:Uncharacterized protein n=1 Tax=Piscinibacter sakaiensis TaxID=1547922 RepID=A0A0K8P3J3_PISS1|nr:hypothetical protein [Piscinibacter sakaiensis]GAP37193.1 hypothetical protein ISF6_3048 [Piscinibacter sakaiensis]